MTSRFDAVGVQLDARAVRKRKLKEHLPGSFGIRKKEVHSDCLLAADLEPEPLGDGLVFGIQNLAAQHAVIALNGKHRHRVIRLCAVLLGIDFTDEKVHRRTVVESLRGRDVHAQISWQTARQTPE